MKAFILLTLLASPLLAQAKPDQRIPVRKQTAGVPGEAPAAAPVIVHDTVIVYRTDTLGVFQSALAAPVSDVAAAPGTCHGLVVPLPIPFPFGRSIGSNNNEVIPTTTTPEPGSLTLFGTGLLGLTMYVKRKKK